MNHLLWKNMVATCGAGIIFASCTQRCLFPENFTLFSDNLLIITQNIFSLLSFTFWNMSKSFGITKMKFQSINYEFWSFGLFWVQAFLNFRGFDFRNFRFTAVYNSILFSSPLVLLSNLDLRGFCFPLFFYVSPH